MNIGPCNKMRDTMKSKWQDPEFRKKMEKSRCDPEYRALLSKVAQERWRDSEYRNKKTEEASKQFIKQWQDPVFRSEATDRAKSLWQDPEFCAKMQKIHNDSEYCQAISNRVKLDWRDPSFVAKQHIACSSRPNKQEIQFTKIVEPFGFQYVGDFQLMINGKNPDFWNGDRKLIELFGDYWHKGEDPSDRIDFFRQFGYDCLVIWEHELDNVSCLLNKVQSFVEGVS